MLTTRPGICDITHHIHEVAYDGANVVRLARLVVHDCHIVVANVHFLLVQALLQVALDVGHQGGGVEDHLSGRIDQIQFQRTIARFHLHSIILPYVSKLPVLVGVQAAHVNSARVSGGGVHQAPKARQKFAAKKKVIICNLRDILSS